MGNHKSCPDGSKPTCYLWACTCDPPTCSLICGRLAPASVDGPLVAWMHVNAWVLGGVVLLGGVAWIAWGVWEVKRRNREYVRVWGGEENGDMGRGVLLG
jgi:hypothetical protein